MSCLLSGLWRLQSLIFRGEQGGRAAGSVSARDKLLCYWIFIWNIYHRHHFTSQHSSLLTTGYIWIEIKTSIQNLIKLFKKELKYNLLYFSQSRNFSCSFFIFLLHKLLLFYIPESLQKSVSKFEKCSCTVRSAHISLSPAGLILHGCRPDIQRF